MVLLWVELQTEGCVVEGVFLRAFTLWHVLLQLLKQGLYRLVVTQAGVSLFCN